MFPAIEMAGLDRCAFIPEVLYLYSLLSSFEWSASKEELAKEKRAERYLRSLKPYERLEGL
jgi:hypothetical protein